MAKGDSTGIEQLGRQLNPNLGNRFTNNPAASQGIQSAPGNIFDRIKDIRSGNFPQQQQGMPPMMPEPMQNQRGMKYNSIMNQQRIPLMVDQPDSQQAMMQQRNIQMPDFQQIMQMMQGGGPARMEMPRANLMQNMRGEMPAQSRGNAFGRFKNRKEEPVKSFRQSKDDESRATLRSNRGERISSMPSPDNFQGFFQNMARGR